MVDMWLEGYELDALKILRLLRTFRPLRFISHNPNLKIVVNAILESLTALINVFIIIILIWVMFAIFGVFIFSGKLGYCSMNEFEMANDMYYNVN
jgi:hypothetical protein